jgi:hypothetical protein
MLELGVRNPSRCAVLRWFITLSGLLFALGGSGVRCTYADTVPAYDQQAYHLFYSSVNPANLQQTVDTLASFGSRVAGYPGEKKAEDYVYQQFVSILGANNVHTDTFRVTVPYDPGAESPAKGAYAQLVSKPGAPKLPMYPLWPNLVRTSTLPAGGLTAPLIYVGDGDLSHFNGKDVEGAVVMVDFNCGQKWLNAPRLGAKAVIFIAPDNTLRGEAEAKFIGIPIAIPRFYMRKHDAAVLLAACAAGRPPLVQLHCDMPWRMETVRNFTGILPGTDPKLRNQIIVVESFYDSTSIVPALAPGAESACSMASLLELMRAFKAHPPKRTMWFVATSAHFQALQGIREYLNQHMDSWMPPGIVQSALAQPNALKVRLWLGAFLVLFLVLSVLAWRNRPQSGPKATPMLIINGISLLVMIGLNAGYYLAPHAPTLPNPPRIYLWAGLDMSSQSPSFGIFYKGWFYDYREDIQGRFSDIARVCRENADKVGQTMGFDSTQFFNDGVNPVNGKNWRNYIPGQPAFDSEVVTMAGGNGVTFATTNDSRALVDTPFDTPDHVNIANLATQQRLLECLMWHIVTDPNNVSDVDAQRMPITDPSQWSRLALQGGFATLEGRVQIFDPHKSFIATSAKRLLGSLVVVRSNTKSFMGVRGNMIQMVQWTTPDKMSDIPTDSEGNPLRYAPDGDALDAQGHPVPCEDFFAFHGVAPLTAYGYNRTVSLAAYHIDEANTVPDPKNPSVQIPNPDRGSIDFAPDMGPEGAEQVPLDVAITTATRSTPIIVFHCVPTAIYDLVDQQSLQALTGINIYDGATNGTPRMYGYAINPQSNGTATSYVEDVAVIFAQPGERLKITMTSGPGDIRLLLINSLYDPTDPFNEHGRSPAPEGIGYLVAGNPTDQEGAEALPDSASPDMAGQGEEIARSGAIYDTALHVAEDMWKLDDFRMRRLARFRILDMKSMEGTPGLHNMAYKTLQEAKLARDKKEWEDFDALSREAWGLESRAYPDVQHTAMDVVEGVLFYLALLMPFAYFCERLFFGFFDLKRQLLTASAIFLLIFAIFRYIHPAFEITMNPVIVLLAFVMLALSAIVIAFVTGKFEEQLKQMSKSVSGVHRADIGRVSVAFAAFNLGVSNMRRRKTRTFLTCTTLVLLTFTVLSFTSVVQVMRFNKVRAPSDYGPRYNGIMIRTPMWDPLQEPAYRILADEYGKKYAVAPRAWFYGTSMGEQSFLTLQRADLSYDARALCGLSPQEAQIMRPQDALVKDANGNTVGRWFKPGDRYVIILPDGIAEALHIGLRDVGTATVNFSGLQFRVIGILNSQKLKRYYDLDNEMLTPVDWIAMNKQSQSNSGGSAASQGFQEYIHLDPDMVFFIPYQTAIDLGAQLRSIAIDFNNPEQVIHQLEPLMRRLELNLYAGQITDPNNPDPAKRGIIYRYSSIATTSSRGLELVVIPIIIAALIVLNTMLNSVYERIREIYIFSSIGLAPTHIGMLFIAEAMVYAILGSVAGYLLGQLTSILLVKTGWLPGLYLNFSSVSAVGTTLIVVGVVLLSTIYPARKAAEVATPAVDRSWKVPDPEGDHWVIPLPFAVTGDQATALNSFLSEWLQAYEEYSIGDFVTQGVQTEERPHIYGTQYSIRCMVWLAPFDLGVSQRIAIETTPTETPDVFEIHLIIDRVSGDISNWKRVNRRFLNTLRKQFLIWRTLKQAERERYLQGNAIDATSEASQPA